MREVTLRVRHRGEPESDVSAEHPAVRIKSVSSLTGSAAQRKRIVELTGPAEEISAFLVEFEETEPVLEAKPFSPLDYDRVFVGVTFDSYKWDSIAQRLADKGVHYRVGTTIKAGWEYWTLYLSDDEEALSDIVASIERANNDVELVRDVSLEEIEGRQHLVLSQMLEALTARQVEVLATAIDVGYYSPGTEVTIQDLADELDIAPTTTWEHLVRAEYKIMSEVGEYLAACGR